MMKKALVKNFITSLNIIEQMKKTNVSVPMWDFLAIPSQRELLQKELKTVVEKNQSSSTHDATSFVKPTKEGETSKKWKYPPFHVSLIISDKFVHNCMVDSGAKSLLMPWCIADLLGVKYEPIAKIVLQLYGSIVTNVRILKNLEMALHAPPSFFHLSLKRLYCTNWWLYCIRLVLHLF